MTAGRPRPPREHSPLDPGSPPAPPRALTLLPGGTCHRRNWGTAAAETASQNLMQPPPRKARPAPAPPSGTRPVARQRHASGRRRPPRAGSRVSPRGGRRPGAPSPGPARGCSLAAGRQASGPDRLTHGCQRYATWVWASPGRAVGARLSGAGMCWPGGRTSSKEAWRMRGQCLPEGQSSK